MGHNFNARSPSRGQVSGYGLIDCGHDPLAAESADRQGPGLSWSPCGPRGIRLTGLPPPPPPPSGAIGTGLFVTALTDVPAAATGTGG